MQNHRASRIESTSPVSEKNQAQVRTKKLHDLTTICSQIFSPFRVDLDQFCRQKASIFQRAVFCNVQNVSKLLRGRFLHFKRSMKRHFVELLTRTNGQFIINNGVID